MKFVSGWRGNL